jgi:hypothetical protein
VTLGTIPSVLKLSRVVEKIDSIPASKACNTCNVVEDNTEYGFLCQQRGVIIIILHTTCTRTRIK